MVTVFTERFSAFTVRVCLILLRGPRLRGRFLNLLHM